MRSALDASLWVCLLITLPGIALAVDARTVTRIDYSLRDVAEHGSFRRVGIESWMRDQGPAHARFIEMGRDVDTIYLLDIARRWYVRLDLTTRQGFERQGRYGDEKLAFRIATVYAVGPETVTKVVYGDATGRAAGYFERQPEGWLEARPGQEPLEWHAAGHDDVAVFLDSPDGAVSTRLDLYRMEMTRSRLGDPRSLERLQILEIDGPPVAPKSIVP